MADIKFHKADMLPSPINSTHDGVWLIADGANNYKHFIITGGVVKELTVSDAGSAEWGEIIGTLSDQTDLNSALSGKQPLDATLTGIAALNPTANQMIYANGSNTFTTVNTSAGGRALLNSAGTANTIPYFSSANTVSTITTSAGGRALLNSAGTINTFPYYSAANTVSLATITPFARTILDDANAAAVRTTLGITTPTLDEVVTASGSYVEATFPSVLMDDDGGSFAIRSHTLSKGISIDTSGTKVSRNLSLIHYGSGEYTGTVSKYLAVTSSGDVIETDAPSGGGSYTEGTGIDITSNVISVKQATSSERGGTKIWKGTQSAYDAIPTKDADTLYFIEDLQSTEIAVYSGMVSSLAPTVGGTIIQLDNAVVPLSIWDRTYDWVLSWKDANGLHTLEDYQGDGFDTIKRIYRESSGAMRIEVLFTGTFEVPIPDNAKLTLHLSDDAPQEPGA